jgi:hypothetical protein
VRKLKCFIATAIGQEDVDDLFLRRIKVVLTENNILPMRVDRIEHNDDIDDKIIELIESCDFCIADLTYARPSVYYEAGRVHGLGKPVIFTVRHDHFKPKHDDEYGNFKIHFDLQMKNIIPWKKKGADVFKKNLKSRVKHIVIPIIRKIRQDILRKQDEEEFNHLPQTEKFNMLFNIAAAHLPDKFVVDKNRISVFNRQAVESLRAACVVKNTKIFVRFLFKSSFTKNELIWLSQQSRYGFSTLEEKKGDHAKLLKIHIFPCSLRLLPLTRISDALPSFKSVKDKIYTYAELGSVFRYMHFIDGIKSVNDFEKRLIAHLASIEKIS